MNKSCTLTDVTKPLKVQDKDKADALAHIDLNNYASMFTVIDSTYLERFGSLSQIVLFDICCSLTILDVLFYVCFNLCFFKLLIM